MTSLSDHDRRQLGRMAERLELFSRGKLALRVLIADIEFLLNALDVVDESIRQQLREHWAILEEVYSVAVTMHAGKLDEQSQSLIQEAVAALRARVAELGETPEPGE